MPLDVFDYRRDVRNVVITPEIRSRFMRMEPGMVASRHSHDVGHEVFLILEGHAEFDVDGERAVLGPGQMCFARADQAHHVRVVGDEPMTLYLSVTPHLEPTHTWWDSTGSKLPPRYGTSTRQERATAGASSPTTGELADRHADAARSLADAAQANAAAQAEAVDALKRAVAAGDLERAKATVDAMWAHVYELSKGFYAFVAAWNELAPRASAGASETR